MDPQAGSLFRSLTISRPQSAAPMLPPMNWQNSGGRPKSFPRSTAEIQDFDAPVKLASRRPVSPLPLFLCKQYDASTKYALRHSRRCLSRNAFPAHDAPVRTSESHTLCSTLFGKRHPCKTKKKRTQTLQCRATWTRLRQGMTGSASAVPGVLRSQAWEQAGPHAFWGLGFRAQGSGMFRVQGV